MKDGIIKGDGTSRKMRATLPATYEEFKQAAGAGEQTLDVMFNAPGWQQQPTFLNKQNLGQDKTMAVYNRGPEGTVDDLFQSVFAVGDIKVSARTDLGDHWLLCNGGAFSYEEYPNLKQIANKKATSWPKVPVMVTGFYSIKYVNGYWFAATSTGTFYSETLDGPWKRCMAKEGALNSGLTEIVYFKGKYYGATLAKSPNYYTVLAYSESPAGPWSYTSYLGTQQYVMLGLWGPMSVSSRYIFLPCYHNDTRKYFLLYSSDPISDAENHSFKSIQMDYKVNGIDGTTQCSCGVATLRDKIFIGGSHVSLSGNNQRGLVIKGINTDTPTIDYNLSYVSGISTDGVILADGSNIGVYSYEGELLYSLGEYPKTSYGGQAYELGDYIVISAYSGNLYIYDKLRKKYIGAAESVSGEFMVKEFTLASFDGTKIVACLSAPTGYVGVAETEQDIITGIVPEFSIPGVYAYIRGK